LDAAAAGEVKGAADFGAAAADETKGAAGFGEAGGGAEAAAGLEDAADDGGDEAAGLDAVAGGGGDNVEGLAAADAGDDAGFGGTGTVLAAPIDGASSVTISVRSSTSSSSLSAVVRAFRSWAFVLFTGLVSLSSFSDMIRRMEDRISSIVGS
jgi:hypothetical protein